MKKKYIYFPKFINRKVNGFLLIHFLGNKQFFIIMFQVTINKSDEKYLNTNLNLHKYILYISEKFEKFLLGFKSLGVFTICITPKENKNVIENKKGLDKNIINNVFLLYFGK